MIATIIKSQTGIGKAADASRSIASAASASAQAPVTSASLEPYGELLYILQTRAHVWERMLKEGKPGYLHYLLDVCFNRGSSAREEALLLKVYRHLLNQCFMDVFLQLQAQHQQHTTGTSSKSSKSSKSSDLFGDWCRAVLKDPRVAFVSERFTRSLDGLAVSDLAPLFRAWLVRAEDEDIAGGRGAAGARAMPGGGGGGGGGASGGAGRSAARARAVEAALHGMHDDVRSWSVGEVGSWLKRSGRKQVVRVMYDHDINGEKLLGMTTEALGGLGIRDMETMASLVSDILLLQDHDTRMYGPADGTSSGERDLPFVALAKDTVSSLVYGWKRLPFSLCFLLREAHDFMKTHFGHEAHGTLLRFVGRLFIHMYISPLFTKGVLLEHLEATGTRRFKPTQEQRAELLSCCDLLEHALLGEGVDPGALPSQPASSHEACVAFYQQHTPRLVEVSRRICQVRSLDDYYGVDEYSDIVTLSEMVVYISPGDMLNLHQMVVSSCASAPASSSSSSSSSSSKPSSTQHAGLGHGSATASARDGASPGREEPDTVLVAALDKLNKELLPYLTVEAQERLLGKDASGTAFGRKETASERVPKAYELGFVGPAVHTPVVVRLKVHVQQTEHGSGGDLQRTLTDTKKKVIDLLRQLKGRADLRAVIYGNVTPREEMAHKAFTMTIMRDKSLNDRARKSTLSTIGASLKDLQRDVQKSIEGVLVPAGLVSAEDGFNSILAAIVKDIREHALLRRFRWKERGKLEASRAMAEAKEMRLQQRVAFYEQYIEQCKQAFGPDVGATSSTSGSTSGNKAAKAAKAQAGAALGSGSNGSGGSRVGSVVSKLKLRRPGRPASKRFEGGVSVNVQPGRGRGRGGGGSSGGGGGGLGPLGEPMTLATTASSASGSATSLTSTRSGVVVQGRDGGGGSQVGAGQMGATNSSAASGIGSSSSSGGGGGGGSGHAGSAGSGSGAGGGKSRVVGSVRRLGNDHVSSETSNATAAVGGKSRAIGAGNAGLFGRLRGKHSQQAAKALAKSKFGTHQYTGQKLKSKGLLVAVHNASRPLKEMTFEFTCYEAGVYSISGQLQRGVYERTQVTWDELEHLLSSGQTELTSLEGCELNVKELMALFKKKFH